MLPYEVDIVVDHDDIILLLILTAGAPRAEHYQLARW